MANENPAEERENILFTVRPLDKRIGVLPKENYGGFRGRMGSEIEIIGHARGLDESDFQAEEVGRIPFQISEMKIPGISDASRTLREHLRHSGLDRDLDHSLFESKLDKFAMELAMCQRFGGDMYLIRKYRKPLISTDGGSVVWGDKPTKKSRTYVDVLPRGADASRLMERQGEELSVHYIGEIALPYETYRAAKESWTSLSGHGGPEVFLESRNQGS